jgi:hypothetical protein
MRKDIKMIDTVYCICPGVSVYMIIVSPLGQSVPGENRIYSWGYPYCFNLHLDEGAQNRDLGLIWTIPNFLVISRT